MNPHNVDKRRCIKAQDICSWVKEQEAIYLYGAGNVCKKFLRVIEWYGFFDKIRGILVSRTTGNVASLNNIGVKAISEVDEPLQGTILVTVSDLLRDEILEELEQHENAYYVYVEKDFEVFLDKKLRKIQRESTFRNIKKLARQDPGENKIDILFLTPPFWDLYAPFSAVPCLVAVLKEKGYTVHQVDLGIQTIHYCFSKHWQSVREHCLSKEFYDNAINHYRHNPYKSYEAYCDDMSFLQKDYYDSDNIRINYKEFNQVQRRVLDELYQFVYLFGKANADFENMVSIQHALDSWNGEDFEEAMASKGIVCQMSNLPDIVGISVTSREQFLPACLLAQICRMLRSDIKIIMGGSCADIFMNSAYPSKRDIYDYFDYVIIGEGETAVSHLVACLKGQGTRDKRIADIPNIMCVRDDGKAVVSKQILEQVETLPVPDYSGLDFSLYLSPEPILPYQASRGCHYGLCAFCNHDEKYRHNYRTKSARKVVQDLLSLHRQYGAKNFQFVDEAIRPDHFRQIVEEMDKYEEFKSFKWIFYSRVSREYNAALLQTARRNGCEMVMFGVETLNQRLLNFIKKGILAEVSKENLKLFHENGIKTFAWLMCNLPSETMEEVRKDLEDVKAMGDVMDAFSVGMFFLDRNTDMSKDPEQFNIVGVDERNPFLFQSHFQGEIIDKDAMIDFFYTQYLAYQRKHFSCGNRYTLFFA